MAERKAVNKYYPPEWDPSKGSLNTFHGQHHLRDRARKLDQGILIIRFEMPFNIWCLGCQKPIGMGVRFNAEKKTIGKYYSTPIYSFRMKCHLCSNWMEIHTDPKNATYLVVVGARRKDEVWRPEKGDTIILEDEETKEKRISNPMFKLQKMQEDREVAQAAVPLLTQLETRSNALWKDNVTQSAQLRKLFRQKKIELKQEMNEKEAFRKKFLLDPSVYIPEESADDLKASEILPKTKKAAPKLTLAHYAAAMKRERKK